MGRPTIHVEHKKRMPSLRVSGLVLLSAASAGVERAYMHAVERMYRRGETQESFLCELENVRLPPALKRLASERMKNRPQASSSTIEVESFVEALPDEAVAPEQAGGAWASDSPKSERQRQKGGEREIRVESGSGKLRQAFPWQRGNQS